MENIDYSSFNGGVTPDQIAAYRKSTSSVIFQGVKAAQIIVFFIVMLACLFGLPLAIVIVVAVIDVYAQGTAGLGFVILSLFGTVVVIGGGLTVSVVALFRWIGRSRRAYFATEVRLNLFAQNNHLSRLQQGSADDAKGMLIKNMAKLDAYDLTYDALTNNDQSFEFGNFTYMVPDGKSSESITWGYIRVKLPQTVPQLVLESKKNEVAGVLFHHSLPAFNRDQTLSLEGDFDKYFTLYAPSDYKQEALEIMTPDLMALLIDTAAQYDVEVVDNQLMVYGTRPFMLTDPNTLKRIFAIIAQVGNAVIADATEYHEGEASASVAAAAPTLQVKKWTFGNFVGLAVLALFLAYLIYNIVHH